MPQNFDVTANYKPGGIFLYSVDVLVFMVSALAILAPDDFDEPLAVFRSDADGMVLKLSSTREQGRQGYQTKTAMWAIGELSCWFNRNHYAEVNFWATYDPNPPIGTGQLLSIPSNKQGSQTQSGNTSELVVGEPIAMVQKRDEDLISVAEIAFADQGAAFLPYHIYTLFMKVLIAEGERDPDDYTFSVTAYNEPGNLSFAMGAKNRYTAADFPNKYVIKAIADLAQKLAMVQEPQLKWKECHFDVFTLSRRGRRKIGRGILKEGRMTPELSELWSNTTKVEPVEIS